MAKEPACERVSKNKQRPARQRAEALISAVREELGGKYVFRHLLAGSAAWGTAIKGPDGTYDLDYQLIITNNSPDFEKNVLRNPSKVKNEFFEAFTRRKKKSERLENSTTAITLRSRAESVVFSIDFVLITSKGDEDLIIRRKKNSPEGGYTWNPLPTRLEDRYRFFRKLPPEEKMVIVERTIEKKCRNKRNPNSKISSSQIFLQEIWDYEQGKRIHQRLRRK